MAYKLSLMGNTRSGIFEIEEASGTVQCVDRAAVERDNRNDCLSWVIVDPKTGSNLEENWVVLHGKPWEIVRTIDTELPIAKFMSNEIFDYLDTVGKDEIVTMAYPIDEPSFLIRNSRLHRTLRESAETVICDLFEVSEVRIFKRNPKGSGGA